MMDNYIPDDVSAEAKALAKTAPRQESGPLKIAVHSRVPTPQCLSPAGPQGRDKIQTFETRALRYGRQEVDLSRVEQLVDSAQLRAIAYLIRHYAERYAPQQMDLEEGLRKALTDVAADELDLITPYIIGTLAMPRLLELVAVVNRMRGLELCHIEFKTK